MQELKQMLALAKKGRASSIKLRSSDKREEEIANKALEKAKAAKAKARTDEEKVRSSVDVPSVAKFLDKSRSCRARVRVTDSVKFLAVRM